MSAVLITALAFRRHAHQERQTLLDRGLHPIDSPHFRPMPEAEFLGFIDRTDVSQVRGVIAGADKFTRKVLDRFLALRVISRWGIGYDAIDVSAATDLGILVTNTPGLLGDAVADLAIGLMIALARKIVAADKLVRRGGWEELSGASVWGKSLGIIGFGSTGQAVARRASGFPMVVRAYDPFPNSEAARNLGVELTSFDDLLAASDYVSLHADLNPSTAKMMNAEAFAKMKPGAFFVNTARGGLVDEAALLAALESGRLAGAALDTHAVEPPHPDNPLFQRDDVIVTPHIAFSTAESIAAVNAAVMRNLTDGMEGRKPAFLVNPDAWQAARARAES